HACRQAVGQTFLSAGNVNGRQECLPHARLAKQAALGGRVERVGVEAQVAEMVGELRRTMRAENLTRLDSPHSFDELIVISVVGQRQSVIDAQAVLSG